jgi:hypothetical protein
MSVTEEYLANNAAYAASFSGPLPLPRRAISPWSPAWTPD